MYVSHPTAAEGRPAAVKAPEQKAWDLAATVCDPEIPVLTIEDLGILRNVQVTKEPNAADGGMVPTVHITITPTYSGCPAMDAIRDDLKAAFKREGYPSVSVDMVLSPAWTTDWMSEAGKAKLQEYGIAPPSGHTAVDGKAVRHAGPVRLSLAVKCPQCSSLNTKELTRFGSTSCKALYVCQDCKEPFDYFKVL
ncbi:1,2-phenylacetyl-CoA epoxidase subunit PaaD [Arthrobacter sp. SO5]|uniref:1,2-phenylacetyl-CoA epoxidase subunit PaaD n=1 Tax=Arthrobacter sp. SO5 TaxID=1897055 RepID=UPI001E4A4E6F|nr:1,2-phenylacetyl-CoA epoxidase subunit PaaD [Arthrobacter sp. SO5]